VTSTEVLPARANEGTECFVCGASATVKMVLAANDPRPGPETTPTLGWSLRWCRQVELCAACVDVASRDHRPLEAALDADLARAGMLEAT